MTLKDIAEKAGVSTMTVSNVINGKHKRVSSETIKKITAIIEEYGYVPNLSARSLSKNASKIIGILISSGSAQNASHFLENPYAGAVIGAIEQDLQKNGYYTMIHSITRQSDVLRLIKNWHADGIIFLYPEADSLLTSALEIGTCPIAVFDSELQNENLINVCSDDEQGLYLSTEYLIQKGHKKIAFAADYQGNPLLTRRFHGYCRALKDYGIPFDSSCVFPFAPTYEGGILAGKAIPLSAPAVTGVVTTSDLCAAGILESCRTRNICVPEDLSVIGFDNSMVCRYTFPALTSVSQSMEEKAKTAVHLLLEKIKNQALSESSYQKLPVKLIERASAAKPRSNKITL